MRLADGVVRSLGIAAWLGVVASVACGGGGPSDVPDPTWVLGSTSLTLDESASPIAGMPAGTRYVANVKYGSDAQQAFDVFLPQASAPTALVIFTHGGGFVGGARTEAYTDAGLTADAKKIVAAGAAWATLDYRLLGDIGVETVGVKKSLYDSRRALQFIRFYSKQLNIDPKRIAMYGGSAGAGTSVWLGFHDDMAQSGNADAIARESTRLSAIGALSTQGTYDVLRWAPDIFGPEYAFVTNDLLLSVKASVDLLLRFYGLPAAAGDDTNALLDTLESPSYRDYRADLDMFVLASSDDPPLFLRTTGADISPLMAGFDVLHHPLHPKTLVETATMAGVKTIVADVPAYQLTSAVDPMDFFLSHF